MNVHTKGKEPLYYQLYLSMVKDIQQGIYKENEKLPSKRAFSDYLGVSQNTSDAAYQMLVTEGYIRALPRSGFYVNPLEASLTVRQEPDVYKRQFQTYVQANPDFSLYRLLIHFDHKTAQYLLLMNRNHREKP